MSFTQEINRLARGEPYERYFTPNWYPSQLGGCDREAVLKHAGILGGELSDETARYFWLGKIVHDNIQTGLGAGTLRAKLGLTPYLYEVPIRGTVTSNYLGESITATLSGRIDLLKVSPCEVIELKTVRSRAFDFPLPQPSHVLQVSCYLAHPPQGFSPQVARIVYIGKDGDRIGEYLIQKDDRLVQQVDDTIVRLEYLFLRYLILGELPPALPMVPLKIKGQLVRYKKSGAWGKAGDVKLTVDHKVLYCDYRGMGVCCGAAKARKVRTAQGKSTQVGEHGQASGTPSEEDGGSKG